MRSVSFRPRALALAGWTLFVWATRIRNALGDDDMSGGSKAVAVTVATLFTLGGLVVLIAVLRRARSATPAVRALAAFTAIYWPVRVVQISMADHDAAFIAVHAVLGAVSVALAVWAWTSVAGRRSSQTAGVLSGR